MPQEPEKDASAAYKPTSLDFINLPNPIQPAPQFQKHPLNGTPRLEKARLESVSNQNLFDLILEPSAERPSKRQKAAENPRLDLPKLPVRNNAKRNRLPPTLSGLHQPPPDAGLLPSISVEQPEHPPPRPKDESKSGPLPTTGQQPTPADAVGTAKSDESKSGQEQPSKPEQKKRNKWTEDETQSLLRGVEQFGIGSWTKILKCPEYTFNHRTALDLKDRFRICCPEHYKRTKVPKYAKTGRYDDPDEKAQTAGVKSNVRGTVPERVSSLAMKKFGVTEPFVKSDRRPKTKFAPADDEALLKGFRRHGKSWSSIRKDRSLGLSDRQATDLRDRMRTRFPEEYRKAGLALKATKPSKHASEEASDQAGGTGGHSVSQNGTSMLGKDSTDTRSTTQRRLPQPRLFSLDDIYLGPFIGDEYENAEQEPITLDRGILDWPTSDNTRTNGLDSSRSNGINPMMTLNLPKLHAVASTSLPGLQASSAAAGNVTSLPSLATLLPVDSGSSDQLELPSLIPLLGSIENDGRSGGSTFPTLDELLS